MRLALAVSFCLLVLAACAPSASKSEPEAASQVRGQALLRLLPPEDELSPWKLSSPPRYFSAEDLWKYMDGGAEAYRAAGVVGMVTAEYAAEEGPAPVLVDIYQMATHEGSQAIYRKEEGTGGHALNFGEESSLGPDALTFYQGRYYVKLVTFDSSPPAQAALLKIGGVLATRTKD